MAKHEPHGGPGSVSHDSPPSDESPVKTQVDDSGDPPAPGQTGHKPTTVAEHNAGVDAHKHKK